MAPQLCITGTPSVRLPLSSGTHTHKEDKEEKEEDEEEKEETEEEEQDEKEEK